MYVVFALAPAFSRLARTGVLLDSAASTMGVEPNSFFAFTSGAGLDQPVHQIGVPVVCGPVESGRPIGRRRLHVDFLINQFDGSRTVTRLNGVDKSHLAERGRRSNGNNGSGRQQNFETHLDLREHLRTVVANLVRFDSRAIDDRQKQIR